VDTHTRSTVKWPMNHEMSKASVHPFPARGLSLISNLQRLRYDVSPFTSARYGVLRKVTRVQGPLTGVIHGQQWTAGAAKQNEASLVDF
jgi:hypothetical protein